MSYQVHGDSKEAVAFGLMQSILFAAGRANQEHPYPAGSTLLRGQGSCSEREILALYARCLRVVTGADPNEHPNEHPGERPATEPAQLHS